jgi:DNA-binding transcriptional LysR family regulator
LLAAHDELWAAFHTTRLQGTVRLGSPDDYALRFLPPVLKRFADSHPGIDVDVLCLPSDELVERLRAGLLDLSLISECHEPADWPKEELWRGPLNWITSERHAPHRLTPLPLALAHRACSWRAAAVAALEAAGMPYRVAYTSASQAGTHAPVLAGLAVTVSPMSWLPEGLRPLRADEGLPPLPDFGIMLLKGREPRQPMTDVLATHIVESFRQDAGRGGRAVAA